MTRAELAQRVSCALETIKKIERDERRPSRQLADLLANVLEVPAGERARFLRFARGERSAAELSLDTRLNPSAPSTFHNLPAESTPLIGREKELTEIARLMADSGCHLLTLIGPGGIGKSRVALQAVREQMSNYRHGVYQVPLAGVRSPEHIPTSIASAYGLELQGAADPRSMLINDLRGKEILLLLDNFEQLLEGAGLLTEILQNAPHLKIMVTSRERLNLQSEWLYPLEGLLFPEADDILHAEQYSSVRLFVQTARRVRAGFSLDAAQLPWVVRICRRVGGLPLAIELAASWTSALTCQEIASEIEKGIDILDVATRDIPEQHRSMRAVFDHSWKRLSDEQWSTLQKLSVFRGGFTRQAAGQVADASLITLSALVDQSLLQIQAQPGGTQRFGWHELVRQYAFERLLESGEADQSLRNHLDYVLHLVDQASPHIHQTEQALWLKSVESEMDNVRAALEWTFKSDRVEDGLRLASALWPFWNELGYLHEGRTWLDQALQKSQPQMSPSRATGCYGAGVLAWAEGDYSQAAAYFEESRIVYQALGDQHGTAKTLKYLGIVALYESDYKRAMQHFEASLRLFQTLQDDWGIATTLVSLGVAAQEHGEYEIARARLEEGLSLHRSRGDAAGVGLALVNLGWTLLNLGDVTRAANIFEESVAHHRQMDDRWSMALSLQNLGRIALLQEKPSQAILLLEESLKLFRKLEDRMNMLYTLTRLGHAALVMGDIQACQAYLKQGHIIIHQVQNKKFQAAWLEAWAALYSFQGQANPAAALAAATLFGAAAALRDQTGIPVPWIEQSEIESSIEAIHKALNEHSFMQAWETGRAMTVKEAATYILGSSGAQ